MTVCGLQVTVNRFPAGFGICIFVEHISLAKALLSENRDLKKGININVYDLNVWECAV